MNKQTTYKKRLFMFTVENCIYCIKQKEILKELIDKNTENIDFDVEILDGNEHPDLIKKHNIIGFPTILIELNEKTTDRMLGFHNVEELEKKIF